MNPLGQDRHGQRPGDDPAQRCGQPKLIVIAATGIETHDQRRAADPRGEVIDVERQIVAAGLFAGLDQHDGAGVRHALLVQRRQSGQRAEHRIAVVGAAAAIEFVAINARQPGAVAVFPADHFGLLVEMTVEQHRIGALAGNLDQDDRGAAGQPHDFQRRAGEGGDLASRPGFEHRHRFVHIAVRGPIGVEHRRLVGDLDVFDQGRDDLVVPGPIGDFFDLGAVQHAASPGIVANLPSPGGLAMIVVFGSINVDVLLPVPHLPARGETVLGTGYRIAPGGKGANQALAARRAGSEVFMAGAVGDDSFAAIGLDLLRRDGVDLSLVATVGEPTACAAITVDPGGDNQIAVASGANLLARAARVPDRLLGPGTVLVLQREVPIEENAELIIRARSRGVRIILSLAPAGPIAPAQLEDIDVLVANEGEAAALGRERPAAIRRLRQALVITRGAAGATAFLSSGGRIDVPALPVGAVDTTGAGDTFAGVLAAGLDAGLTLEVALRRASVAAALACLALGAQEAMPGRIAIDEAAAQLG